MEKGRWSEKCVVHLDQEVLSFFKEHFKERHRACLVIGGAGFDPRSSEIIKDLHDVLGERLSAKLIKEERPDPDHRLVERADSNLEYIKRFCNKVVVDKVEIFAGDDAVIGGRNVIEVISKIDFSVYTDILIDLSALSMGISFPIVSFVYKTAKERNIKVNVHLALLSNPDLDAAIKSEPNEKTSEIFGFKFQNLYGELEKASLWLPLLSENKQEVLKKIHATLSPHDICPILPFPSEEPKKGDRIAFQTYNSLESEWGGLLDNEWELDPKNFVYADERTPLDIYRSILRIDDERKPVFETFGGSTTILSPLGSKIPAIGALMAAIERNFPVIYVESLKYVVDWSKVNDIVSGQSKMTHVWLYGPDAYLSDQKGSTI